MYGYTPPLVVAVDSELLTDLAGFQRVAAALADQLSRRPAWIAVHAPQRLVDRCQGADLDLAALVDALEALDAVPGRPILDLDPTVDTPRTWLERAVADLLRHHLLDIGLDLPVVGLSADAPLPRRASAILSAGILRQEGGASHLLESANSVLPAVTAARELGSTQVEVWTANLGDASQATGGDAAQTLASKAGVTISVTALPHTQVQISGASASRKADA